MMKKMMPLQKIPVWKRSLGRKRVVRLPQKGAANAAIRDEPPMIKPVHSMVVFMSYVLTFRMKKGMNDMMQLKEKDIPNWDMATK